MRVYLIRIGNDYGTLKVSKEDDVWSEEELANMRYGVVNGEEETK